MFNFNPTINSHQTPAHNISDITFTALVLDCLESEHRFPTDISVLRMSHVWNQKPRVFSRLKTKNHFASFTNRYYINQRTSTHLTKSEASNLHKKVKTTKECWDWEKEFPLEMRWFLAYIYMQKCFLFYLLGHKNFK